MLLKKAEHMTVSELSREMAITPMAVRQHLMSLERKGLVRYDSKKYGIGRPMFLYKLTEKANNIFPNSYGNFLLEVLQTVEEMDGRDKVDLIFKTRKEKQLEKKQRLLSGIQDFAKKIIFFTELLEKDGFLVELEETNGQFNLKQFNCLLSDVTAEFPEACQYELELYQDIFGAHVVRSECQREGAAYCNYVVPRA